MKQMRYTQQQLEETIIELSNIEKRIPELQQRKSKLRDVLHRLNQEKCQLDHKDSIEKDDK